MDHPTTSWAVRYAMPDPGHAADEVLRMAPAELTARFRAVAEMARRIDDASTLADPALVLVRDAWSTGPAAAALAALLTSARSGALVLAGQAIAATHAASIVEHAQLAVRAGYAWADQAIARSDLLRADPPIATPPEAGPFNSWIHQERMSVVSELGSRVAAAAMAATGAIVDLRASLAGDARPRLAALRAPSGLLPSRDPDPTAMADRDNRAALRADLLGTDPVRARFAHQVQQALAHATATTATTVQLLTYDPVHPAAQGSAAIAVGDVSTAEDVAVIVPGVGNSPSSMDRAVDAAAEVRAAATAADPAADVAAITWIGYDVPLSWPHDLPMDPVRALADSVTALDATSAVDAGARLAAFTSHLREVKAPSARMILIGHSYGSLVVSQSATGTTDIDDVVLLAAPGAGPGVHHAADYRAVASDHVYALSFPHDPITTPVADVLTAFLVPAPARLAGSTFGDDPATAGFGAQVIAAPSHVPVIHPGSIGSAPGGLPQALVVDTLADLTQHPMTNYLAGAAGLAVGAIVVGRYSAVRTTKGR